MTRSRIFGILAVAAVAMTTGLKRREIFDFPAVTTPGHDWAAPGRCMTGDGRDKPGLGTAL